MARTLFIHRRLWMNRLIHPSSPSLASSSTRCDSVEEIPRRDQRWWLRRSWRALTLRFSRPEHLQIRLKKKRWRILSSFQCMDTRMRGFGNLGFSRGEAMMRSSSDIGSSAMLWKMRRSVIVWFAIASVVCTAVMFVAVGPWLQSNIKRGLDSFLVGRSNEIEVRPRHEPPWRERHDLDNNGNVEFPGLKDILERASMPNRTIILTTLNEAWAQPNTMIHLFLESFRAGEDIVHLLDHLVVVALDQVAYDRCRELHTLCYILKTAGVDFAGEKFFMTEDYLRMMWRRIYFLKHILEMGYSFLFTDADVMWFRDPFLRFDKAADFQIASDSYSGLPEDLNNRPNGGFLFARSNKRTIDFYKYWYMSRLDYPGLHDQDVLNQIKADQDFFDIGLQFRFLDTLYFSGFCQVSKDLEQVCTMHANCCTGLQRKLHDLRLIMEDWKRFTLLSPQLKHHQRVYWRAPRQCLLSFGGVP